MAIDAFETMTLVGVLDRQPTERLFFLDEFFTSEITFTTETIAFDEVGERYRKLAPFVAPNVQGRVMKSQGFTTKTFRPAYVKPKHIVDPNKQFARRAGEALAVGSLTPGQRFDAAVAENLRIEQDMIRRRENWMAAQAVIHGTVLVAGEDYPPVTVDFGRDAGLTSVLAGTARWGEADADPLANLAAMRAAAKRKSGGAINRIIMGEEAYDRFYANADVKELLNNNFRTGSSQADSSFLGNTGDDDGFELKAIMQGGQNGGRIEIGTYSDYYHEEQEDGTVLERQIMDPNAVIGVGRKMRGTRCYGAIRDRRAGLRALRVFPKVYDNEDPPVTYTLSQSAPLPIPVEPNNTFYIQAHDAEV
jgi:hypothetical protein